MDFCLRKTRSGKSPDYRDAVEKLRFQNVFCPRENEKPGFSNFSGLKSVFGENLRFLDELVSIVGLTVEINIRFVKISPSRLE